MKHPPAERAILLVDHGSRRAEANLQLEEIARQVREREPGTIVATAHLEIAEPSVGEAVDACVRAGAQTIVIHPYFLGPGRHTREDLPRLIDAASLRHPGVVMHLSAPLGVHEKLVDVVLERVGECSKRTSN